MRTKVEMGKRALDMLGEIAEIDMDHSLNKITDSEYVQKIKKVLRNP